MQIYTELTTSVISLAYGGAGVIKDKNITGFVSGVLPGELVRVRIEKTKKKYFQARLLDILEPSLYRITPICQYFNNCGGCVYQHLSYEKQAEYKATQVLELLKHIGGIPDIETSQTIHSPKTFNYRNQITLKLKNAKLGFVGIDNETFVPIEKCFIAMDTINNIIPEITNGIGKSLKGEISIKCGADGAIDYAFTESITQKGEYKLLYEKINGRIYYFSLATFFQVNPYILPDFLSQVKIALDISPDTTLFDLYCGTGLFSIYLAPFVKNAYGIESNPSAVRMAQKNSKENNANNCHFFEGDAETVFQEIYNQYKTKKDIIIVDPPRKGLNKGMIEYLKHISPSLLAYISCEPSILARDLKFLTETGYKISNIIAIDMFPQTKYLETLTICKYSLVEHNVNSNAKHCA